MSAAEEAPTCPKTSGGIFYVLFYALLIAVCVSVSLAWPSLSFYARTKRFSPISKVETLQNPVAVKAWTSNSLVLVDGRTVQIPGVRELPVEASALTEITKRGIEVGPDGRTYALVRIHHWCGNDPVRNHIVKVDLSRTLMFLHIGVPLEAVPRAEDTAWEDGGDFFKWGWNVSEFTRFKSWLAVTENVQRTFTNLAAEPALTQASLLRHAL